MLLSLHRSLEEKRIAPRSRWTVTGLYIYDGDVARMARAMKPSSRGELKITDLTRIYLAAGKAQC